LILMDLLFEERFAEYLREASLADRLCIFVHVPKTAGTSLRSELALRLQPDANIAVDYTDTSRSFHERMDDAVRDFLDTEVARGVRFASGHILGRHAARIRCDRPDARFVTFLRDPVQRVVSDYRHQRSPRHPVHAEFIARVPSLEAYLDIRWERDKAAQHLIAPEVLIAADPEECVDYLLRSYAFIGVQEMYPISFRTLTALIGQPAWPKLRENVNADDDAERQVTPELAARIRAANPIDTALYEAVFPRWQTVRDALARHLA
jgi:hypothetical protein